MNDDSARPAVCVINDREFRLFQRLMFEEAGVTLAASKKALVNGRLAKQVRTLGCQNFSEYYKLVHKDKGALQAVVDLLTTNETYFFREPRHFDFLATQVLPGHVRGKPFRVWSAACSSGEEVYSVAMVLADKLGDADWTVLGSDINTQVLDKARKGHYSFARTEGISRRYLEQYCLKGKGSQVGTFMIGQRLRERTQFRQVNLNANTPDIGLFDVIFLRNVMIYFSPDTKAQVVQRLARRLQPGGYLITGHSETLNGISCGLELLRPSIYRRPL